MTAIPAGVRLRRLLAILPWLADRGSATVSEIAERFGMTPAHVVSDLELAACCGLPPYSPDELFEIIVDDDIVTARFSRLFHRRQTFTNAEAVAVLAAGRTMLALAESGSLPELTTALAKVAAALGDVDFEVEFGMDADQASHLHTIRDAIEAAVCVEIEYQSAWRDESTVRTIEPVDVTLRDRQWYVAAWCQSSVAWRTFRLDRVVRAQALSDKASQHESRRGDDGVQDGASTVARVVIDDHQRDLVASVAGVVFESLDNGRVVAAIPVTNEEWLGTLLCRLGSGASVVAPPQWIDLRRETARKVLARYL